MMPGSNRDVLDRMCEQVRVALEDRRKRTSREIHSYPSPIAGCDAQFNHLLEVRSNVLAELQRLARINEADSSVGEYAEALDAFLCSCAYIDERKKQELRTSLTSIAAATSTA